MLVIIRIWHLKDARNISLARQVTSFRLIILEMGDTWQIKTKIFASGKLSNVATLFPFCGRYFIGPVVLNIC